MAFDENIERRSTEQLHIQDSAQGLNNLVTVIAGGGGNYDFGDAHGPRLFQEFSASLNLPIRYQGASEWNECLTVQRCYFKQSIETKNPASRVRYRII